MDIEIKVDHALAHMRVKRGKKVTREELSDAVFGTDKIAEKTRIQYLSRWSKGQGIENMRVIHLIRMSEFTGLKMEELIEKN